MDQQLASESEDVGPVDLQANPDQALECVEDEEQQETSIEQHELPLGPDDTCDTNPEFAVICSFIAQFGDKIDLLLDLEQLKSSIENRETLDDSLIDIHVKLLKKIRRYFVKDQWEKALIKYACEYSYEDAYEIESLGYLKTRPSVKLTLLRRLLDAQFECDQKFKASINATEANELRIAPMGRDIKGNIYWDRLDIEGNFRIFQEQPLDFTQWKTVCKDIDDLGNLISELDACKDETPKGQPATEPYNPLPLIFPQYFLSHEKSIEEPTDRKEPKTCKKGKGKASRRSKASTLPPVNEVSTDDETKLSSGLSQTDIKPIIKADPFGTSLLKRTLNVEIKQEPIENLNLCYSIEDQVKSTLETLLRDVALSTEILHSSTLNESKPQELPREECQPEAKAKPQRKRQPKKERKFEEVLPRRTSSRIQQLQLKKQEEEQKKVVELDSLKKSSSCVSMADSHSVTSSRGTKKRSESPDNTDRGKKKRGKSWRPGQKSKKLSWDKDDSDISTASSPSDFEDDLDETIQSDAINYEDEFACEEEEAADEPVIVKRARTARPSLGHDNQGNQSIATVVEEDKPCGRCGGSHDPDWILLCDMCDDGYHTLCCLPPLMIIPDGDWFCPPCEHKMLMEKLRNLHTAISEILEEKERERLKRQRLRQNTVKKQEPIVLRIDTHSLKDHQKNRKYSYDEIAHPTAQQGAAATFSDDDEERADLESRVGRTRKTQRTYSGKRRKLVNNEDNELENDEVNEYRNNGRERACKRTQRLEWDEISSSEDGSGDKSESDAVIESEDSDENFESDELADASDSDRTEENSRFASSVSSDEIVPKTRRARASVSYRFQEYDDLIQSAIRDDSNDEAAIEPEEAPVVEYNYGRGKDMATIEAMAYQQENGLLEQDITDGSRIEKKDLEAVAKEPKGGRRKKKRRRLNDLDADSDTGDTTSDESFQASSATEAEDEDDDLTEAGSMDNSDSSIDEIVAIKHVRKRSKQRKRQSGYESDDSDYQPRSRRTTSKGFGLLID